MKRYIKSSSALPNKWELDKGDGHRFIMRYSDPDRLGTFTADITEVHPYNDADYAWAHVDGLSAKFYNRQGYIDKMHLWSYEPEDYADDVAGYVYDVFDAVCDELIKMNEKVKPVMVHN